MQWVFTLSACVLLSVLITGSSSTSGTMEVQILEQSFATRKQSKQLNGQKWSNVDVLLSTRMCSQVPMLFPFMAIVVLLL